MKFKLVESLSDTLFDIQRFNERLNEFEYIVYNSECKYKPNVTDKDMEKNYRMLSPNDFEKFGGGVCWDYVIYEADFFKHNFPDVKFDVYFWLPNDDEVNPTHTFLLFYYKDKCYWFESSWKDYCGIYKFNNDTDALNYISSEMIKGIKNYQYHYLIKYNPLNPKLYGMTYVQFMEYIKKKRKEQIVELGKIKNPVKLD